MARNARANYGEAVPVLYSHNTEVLNLIQQRESVIDKLEVNISNYLVKVTDRELNESESHAVNELINFIVEYERIGDYAINVVERSGEMFDKEITFSESARRELSLVDNAIKEIMDITLAAFQADDTVLAEQVEPLEETIDLMIDTLRERHILRLKNGVCAIESGIIFLEILTNLERISDHCSNIAARIVGKESEDDHFDAHEFRRNMHDGYVPNFNEMLAQYKLKYYTPLLESQETALSRSYENKKTAPRRTLECIRAGRFSAEKRRRTANTALYAARRFLKRVLIVGIDFDILGGAGFVKPRQRRQRRCDGGGHGEYLQDKFEHSNTPPAISMPAFAGRCGIRGCGGEKREHCERTRAGQ